MSSPILSFGLDSATTAEAVRLLWPSGVLQAEVDVKGNQVWSVKEVDRKGSSCPFVFAWDGTRMAFVSDIASAAPLGLWVAPGMRALPDPDEWLPLPETTTPDGAAYRVSITDSLEEVIYVDRAKLRVIDHPEGVRVYPNERLTMMPPFPGDKIHAVVQTLAVERATTGAGEDLSSELAARDGVYTQGFLRTSFKGVARPHTLDLDFGPLPRLKSAERFVLLAYGALEFSNSTYILGASQAHIRLQPPSLEILDDHGRVLATHNDLGTPAGLPKWMAYDLGAKLPGAARRLRITTNLDLAYDQILLGIADEHATTRVSELEATRAELRFLGYPRATRPAAGAPPVYDYDKRLSSETWRDQFGYATRFGEVGELLAQSDDRLVVMVHGDEVALSFDSSSLPALPTGWKRDLWLYAVAYAKDMNLVSASSDTIGPLPYRDMASYPYDGPGPFAREGYAQSIAAYATREVKLRR